MAQSLGLPRQEQHLSGLYSKRKLRDLSRLLRTEQCHDLAEIAFLLLNTQLLLIQVPSLEPSKRLTSTRRVSLSFASGSTSVNGGVHSACTRNTTVAHFLVAPLLALPTVEPINHLQPPDSLIQPQRPRTPLCCPSSVETAVCRRQGAHLRGTRIAKTLAQPRVLRRKWRVWHGRTRCAGGCVWFLERESYCEVRISEGPAQATSQWVRCHPVWVGRKHTACLECHLPAAHAEHFHSSQLFQYSRNDAKSVSTSTIQPHQW